VQHIYVVNDTLDVYLLAYIYNVVKVT